MPDSYYIRPLRDIETRLEEFFAYHARHPRTYVLFCHFVKKLTDRGFKHYSVDAIFHAIRWHTDLEADHLPEDDEDDFFDLPTFKISAVWRIFYGRLWQQDHPEFKGFFRTRVTNEARFLDVKGRFQDWLQSNIPTPDPEPPQ